MAISVSGVSNAQNPVPVANNPSAPQPTTLPVNSAAPKDTVTISPQGRQAQTQAAQSQAGAKAQNAADSKHNRH